MIKHVVLFKFKNELSPVEKKEKLTAIKNSLEKLKSIISELQSIEVGLNSNPAESYDLALISECKTWEELKSYAIHPEHQRVTAVIRQDLDQRACVDYVF